MRIELNFLEALLLMRLIERESVVNSYNLDPALASAYQKIQKAEIEERREEIEAL